MKPLPFSLRAALRLLLTAGALGLGLPQTAPADPASRTVTDMNGKVVSIPYSVNRVGSTGAVNQMVLMLGTPWKLTVVSPANRDNRWMRRVYPGIAEAAAPFSGSDVNMEELIKSKPDAIFLIDNSGTHSSFKSLPKLQESGIPVIQVHLRTPEEMKQAVRLVGETLGPQERQNAERFCQEYDAILARIRAKIAPLPCGERLKVYRAGGINGLTSEGGNTITTSWIEEAGGINVVAAAGIQALGASITMEDVLQWNPDVIITMGVAAKEAVLARPEWKSVNAVRNGRVYVSPVGVYQWSVRSAETALQNLWAAKVIHPELFPDLDMNAEVRHFYQIYYGCELSEAEANEILNPPK